MHLPVDSVCTSSDSSSVYPSTAVMANLMTYHDTVITACILLTLYKLLIKVKVTTACNFPNVHTQAEDKRIKDHYNLESEMIKAQQKVS